MKSSTFELGVKLPILDLHVFQHCLRSTCTTLVLYLCRLVVFQEFDQTLESRSIYNAVMSFWRPLHFVVPHLVASSRDKRQIVRIKHLSAPANHVNTWTIPTWAGDSFEQSLRFLSPVTQRGKHIVSKFSFRLKKLNEVHIKRTEGTVEGQAQNCGPKSSMMLPKVLQMYWKKLKCSKWNMTCMCQTTTIDILFDRP